MAPTDPAASVAPVALLSGGGPVPVGGARLSIEDVVQVALGGRGVELSPDPAFRGRVKGSAAFLDRLLDSGAEVYGVNTGYGDSCTVSIPPELVRELPATWPAITVAAWGPSWMPPRCWRCSPPG
jgi:histidine ammonia-lyase